MRASVLLGSVRSREEEERRGEERLAVDSVTRLRQLSINITLSSQYCLWLAWGQSAQVDADWLRRFGLGRVGSGGWAWVGGVKTTLGLIFIGFRMVGWWLGGGCGAGGWAG